MEQGKWSLLRLTHAHTFITDPAFEGIDGNVYYDRNDDTISLL
jgi:CO dehydrogenase/acetyl-CoA synthase epsilon subunit